MSILFTMHWKAVLALAVLSLHHYICPILRHRKIVICRVLCCAVICCALCASAMICYGCVFTRTDLSYSSSRSFSAFSLAAETHTHIIPIRHLARPRSGKCETVRVILLSQQCSRCLCVQCDVSISLLFRSSHVQQNE